VPYILSGLFDQDELVRSTALEAIADIGRQIEV
jgi:HEAT repeat protein